MLKSAAKLSLLFSISVTALSGCAPVDALNAITPDKGYEISEVVFRDGERGDMDIYTPNEVREDSPVIVFFYGGGWNSGEKSEYKFVGQAFAEKGYIAALPNYRIYPDAAFPDFITDGAQAVREVTTLYPDRPIVLIGHSAGGYAGGYIVDMLALNDRNLQEVDVERCKVIAGVVPLAGPVGIVPLSEEPYISIFPDRLTGQDAPLNVVEPGNPVFFFVHGKDDTTVYPQNSQLLATKILVSGGKASHRIYDDHDHIDTVKNLSVYFDDGSMKDDILRFIAGLPKDGNYCHGGTQP